MAEGDEAVSSHGRRSFRSRACENCRLRKIRCDKAIPCSSCGTLGLVCKAAAAAPAAQPTTEQRQRITLSHQYERKIDQIQEQLVAIQQTLQEIPRNATPGTPTASKSVSTPTTSTSIIPTFEGQSSFSNETLLARDAAYSAVSAIPGTKLDESVCTALLSLKDSLDRHHSITKADSSRIISTPQNNSREDPSLVLLPVDFVVALVKKIKTQPPFSLVSHSWGNHIQIETLCQKIYFPSESLAPGSTTLLHGLLYYIIRDYAHEDTHQLPNPDFINYIKLCERNFSSGLNSYEMMVNPTLEKVQALLIGVIKSQEESNLQLCWTYLSVAFNMCQSMGYHRHVTLKQDSLALAEAKRHVFWSLYTIDKNVSLNLGLTSHFQDHDIDAEFFTPSEDPKQCPWDLMTLVTIKFSTIQGQVYDQLYSVAAAKAPPASTAASIEKLSAALIVVRNELLAIDVHPGLYSESLQGMALCADFITYSVLTVIYRAQTLPTNATAITSKCVEAATLALESHLKCFAIFRTRESHKQAEYVKWILLYPSFTPFVIIFTHAIATSSARDFALLQETVSSLELCKNLSQGSARLYEICKAFLNTARVLIESRQTLMGFEQHDDGSLFVPATGVKGQSNALAVPDVSWPDDMSEFNMNSADISVFLNDFLSTNRPVMDMLNMNMN
ncbi:hypothetical protein ASPZODRAFT_58444 [Penicilliopsis zonata CBS 506.65]|uniref:Zn(2)-C6 fungal-type domain-containing protein n=1 Tax=Penicilliopsis zonata CBS 506.65 TaxID=1073090 RepID=A0A1L9SSQ4_9EURO|nr:hypothetical protein ASPZODRAFT_58444 [Penicilliopsis zonata CBS 506.65]OJJ50225.1 hypothetical protein ASPZODRAFT_58444 [Penicilliopsis zonata CBS 506.65]